MSFFSKAKILAQAGMQSMGLKPYAVVVDDLPRAPGPEPEIVGHLRAGRWNQAHAAFCNLSADDFSDLSDAANSPADALALARAWARGAPGSAHAQVNLGRCLNNTAADARGSGWANEVSQEGWKVFHELNAEAERVLLRAAALDPTHPEPHALLIWTSLALSRPLEETRRCFDAAVALVPDHWNAHYAFLTASTAKWCGSHEEMFDFALEVGERRPPGDPLHSMLAGAYNELALQLVTSEGPVEGCAQMRDEDDAQELAAAYYKWLDATPQNHTSVIAERARAGKLGNFAPNEFAVALYLTGAHDEARAVLLALNARIIKYPWVWIATTALDQQSSGFVYDRICKELGVKPDLPSVREVMDGKRSL